MNGTKRVQKVPQFLEGEPLPKGYFDPPNPYSAAPTRRIDLSALVTYARKKGKNCWDLTKEEVSKFSVE